MKNVNNFQTHDWAEFAIKRAKERYGRNLDYTENSLESLDDLLGIAHEYFKQSAQDSNKSNDNLNNRAPMGSSSFLGKLISGNWGGNSKFNDNLEDTILMWGSFLGELIRRNCGGNWVTAKSGIFLASNNFTANPFEQVRSQIVKGSLYSHSAKLFFHNIQSHHLLSDFIRTMIGQNEAMVDILNDNSDDFPQVNSWIVAINKVLSLVRQFPHMQFPNNDINVMLSYIEKIRDRFMEMLIVGENTLETWDEGSSDAITKAFLIPGRELTYTSLVGFHEHYQKRHQRLQQWSELRNTASDITTYKTDEILKSGSFTAEERKAEYRRRGKSPSGVIDGVYNDMYLESGTSYNDANRDWEADA